MEPDEKHDEYNIITEEEMVDMFGEGGAEEIREYYDPLFEVEKENAAADAAWSVAKSAESAIYKKLHDYVIKRAKL